MVCLSRPYHFKFFKGCLPQMLLGPFLNTLIDMFSDFPNIFLFSISRNLNLTGALVLKRFLRIYWWKRASFPPRPLRRTFVGHVFSVYLEPDRKEWQYFQKSNAPCRVALIYSWSEERYGKVIISTFFGGCRLFCSISIWLHNKKSVHL